MASGGSFIQTTPPRRFRDGVASVLLTRCIVFNWSQGQCAKRMRTTSTCPGYLLLTRLAMKGKQDVPAAWGKTRMPKLPASGARRATYASANTSGI